MKDNYILFCLSVSLHGDIKKCFLVRRPYFRGDDEDSAEGVSAGTSDGFSQSGECSLIATCVPALSGLW